MRAITIKQTNHLVPVGANVNINYSGDDKFSLIWNNQWFGDYDVSCFKSTEKLSQVTGGYLEVIGQINSLMGFKNNNYSLISGNELVINNLFN